MCQQVLQQQKQKKSQEGQVEEGHLHIQLNNSEINFTEDVQAPLDQSEKASFGFLQKKSSNTKAAEASATLDTKRYISTRAQFLIMRLLMNT